MRWPCNYRHRSYHKIMLDIYNVFLLKYRLRTQKVFDSIESVSLKIGPGINLMLGFIFVFIENLLILCYPKNNSNIIFLEKLSLRLNYPGR